MLSRIEMSGLACYNTGYENVDWLELTSNDNPVWFMILQYVSDQDNMDCWKYVINNSNTGWFSMFPVST